MTKPVLAGEFDSPTEFKSGDDPTGEIEKAIANFETKFKEAVEKSDKAMKEIEKKAAERADALEAKLARPAIIEKKDGEQTLEQKAFDTFIRKGKEALGADEQKALTVSDDTAGGFLAPEQLVAELDRNLVLFSPVRSIARVMTTGAPSVKLPKRTGGMTAAWVGETDDRPETSVTFGQNEYPVREIAAWVDVSNALLEDSTFDIASLLAFEFAEEFGAKEGVAFVNGTGVKDPLGFMADGNIGYSPGGDASNLKADGIIDLYHSIKTPYRASAVFGMNSATLAACRKLKDGTSGQYLLLTQGIGNAPVTTLLGRPVVEMPDMPSVEANAYPIVFGDFNQGYRIFDRLALSILRDPYSQATKGMTRFHARRRVAGGVGKAEALKKLKIATS